jgi:hemoglobin
LRHGLGLLTTYQKLDQSSSNFTCGHGAQSEHLRRDRTYIRGNIWLCNACNNSGQAACARIRATKLPQVLKPKLVPYEHMGETMSRALAERFYDLMELSEPALAELHTLAPDSLPGALRVHPEVRLRFGWFLIGWLGGAQTYTETYGHPRLRMRHAHIQIDVAGRDAWLRCMFQAMRDVEVPEQVRAYLEPRFAEVADFLRNDAAKQTE